MLTVLLPHYHTTDHPRRHLINEVVARILATPIPLKLVILDNGSEPSLLKELFPFDLQKDKEINVIRLEQNNPNPWLYLSQFAPRTYDDYVCWMCDDDLVTPRVLADAAHVLDRSPFSPLVMSDPNNPLEHVTFDDAFTRNPCHWSGTVFRSCYLSRLEESQQGLTVDQDWAFWLELLRYGASPNLQRPLIEPIPVQNTDTSTNGFGKAKFVHEHIILWNRWLMENYRPTPRQWELMSATMLWYLERTHISFHEGLELLKNVLFLQEKVHELDRRAERVRQIPTQSPSTGVSEPDSTDAAGRTSSEDPLEELSGDAEVSSL